MMFALGFAFNSVSAESWSKQSLVRNVRLCAAVASTMFQHNATKYFESKNISISDLNITSENLNDFLQKLVQLNKQAGGAGLHLLHGNASSHSDEMGRGGSLNGAEDESVARCDYECDGFFRDVLGRYEGWHGYVALVVSMKWYKYLRTYGRKQDAL